MVWSGYLDESYTYDPVPMDDQEQMEQSYDPLEFEDWVDWFEPHLSNLWRDFCAYRHDSGLSRILGRRMDYWDFVRFLYDMSDQRAIPIM